VNYLPNQFKFICNGPEGAHSFMELVEVGNRPSHFVCPFCRTVFGDKWTDTQEKLDNIIDRILTARAPMLGQDADELIKFSKLALADYQSIKCLKTNNKGNF
jgi:hypothetical protein